MMITLKNGDDTFDVLVYIKNEIAKGQGRGYVGG